MHERPYPTQYPHPYLPANSAYPAPTNYGQLPPIGNPDRRGLAPIDASNLSNAACPPIKRIASATHPAESPAKKKQSKWSAEEDAAIIELRGNGMKWEDISKNLPGRSAISCRLRFQNYLERRSEWDEEKKNKLARLYERFKKDMWEKIAKEMALPWRAAEAMHWQIGEVEMANRANVPVFHLAGQQQAATQMPLHVSTSSSTSASATEMQSHSASPNSAHEGFPPHNPVSEALPAFDPRLSSQPTTPGHDRLRRQSDASMAGAEDARQYSTFAQQRITPVPSELDVPAGQRQYLSPFRGP